MKLYNTLTRQKEEFMPLKENELGMYSCGITAYDDCHIGHARSAFVSDLVKRYFEYRGYIVKAIRNVTDIDDKIIDRVLSQGGGSGDIKEACAALSEKYSLQYAEQMGALGLLPPTAEPRATACIKEIQALITRLIDRGYAYVSGGDVYFEVKKFTEYGKLSNQKSDALRSGSRIPAGEKKNDPLDFALWKASKEGEPAWESPWGDGRPGWHIECSCMSMQYLDETFDIHVGGEDLVFPHHENEIAQSEAATGKVFARFWLHHGLVSINGEKMSKSLGNFVRVSDALAYGADTLKLLFLSSHYRSAVDFSEEKIQAMQRSLNRFKVLFQEKEGVSVQVTMTKNLIERVRQSKEGKQIDELLRAFDEALADDLNTPLAIAHLFSMVDVIQTTVGGDPKAIENDPLAHYARYMILLKARQVFGLFQDVHINYKIVEDASDEIIVGVDYDSRKGDIERIEQLIIERQQARKNKDFARADQIRDDLLKEGIILEDTKIGSTSWRKE